MKQEEDLSKKQCKPCKGEESMLPKVEALELLEKVPTWQLQWQEHKKYIEHTFKFRTFQQGIEFINRMAEIADKEGHHPDFSVKYNRVHVKLQTHAIGGLSENDFILAAKIDDLLERKGKFWTLKQENRSEVWSPYEDFLKRTSPRL